MITLSQNAFQTIQRLKAENRRPHAALRIAVLGGDCSGLKYFIGLDEFRAADDIAIDYDGQLVYVDITLPNVGDKDGYCWGGMSDIGAYKFMEVTAVY